MSSVRGQLISVGESFVGFDKAIAEDAKRRRARQAKDTKDVEEAISRLSDDVLTEIRARVYDVRDLQKFAEAACNAMLESLQDTAIRRLANLADTVELMQARVLTLERGMAQFKGELPSKLQVDTAALMQEAAALKVSVEQMRTLGRNVDDEMSAKMDQLEEDALKSAEQNRVIAGVKFSEATADCERMVKPTNSSQEEKFRDFTLQEFATVKTAMTLEAEQRQKSDNEILDAIKFYSDALQRGIRDSKRRRDSN